MIKEEETIRLEVLQASSGGDEEEVWKDAGPIHLLDGHGNPPFQHEGDPAPPIASVDEATDSSERRALPKLAKEWLLSKHTIRTNKERQNLYLFRKAKGGRQQRQRQRQPQQQHVAAADTISNTNLLILLHGAGDTHRPFDKLAQTMALPQTASLALSSRITGGGVELPFGLGHSWFQELDVTTTGYPLPRGHVSMETSLQVAVDYLSELIRRLTTSSSAGCWPPERIFLLGYGAGATVVMETCRVWTSPSSLGGAICIGQESLSINASQPPVSSSFTSTVVGYDNKSSTPADISTGTPILLLSHDETFMNECKREYEMARSRGVVVETHVQANNGMIATSDEMRAVMKFLSKRLVITASQGGDSFSSTGSR